MSQQFDNLKAKLREAGCTLRCTLQIIKEDKRFESWSIILPDTITMVNIVVIDEKESGYRLFIENDTIKMSDDISCILNHEVINKFKTLIPEIALKS